MRYAPRLLPVGLLALSALAACTDQLEAPTASLRTDPALEARGPLRDAEIDRSDTHFGARVVTTTERHDGEALLSAGDPMLTASEDEVYVEGGYGRDGQLRFSVYFESAANSPRIGSTRLVGNEVQTYDRSGRLLSRQHVDQSMAWAGLPSADFSQAYFSSTPPTCPPEALECAAFGASLQADASAGADSDVRVVRVRPLDGQRGAANRSAEIEQRFRRIRRANAGSPEAWRLEETRRTERRSVRGREEVTTTVTRVHFRSWDRNEGKERGRKAAREAREQAPPPRRAPASSAVSPAVTPPAATSMLARRSSVADAAAAEDPQLLQVLCRRGTTELDRYRPEVERGYLAVYQHGFCSNAGVFFSFDERLAQGVAIQRSRAFSLESTARLESQAAELRTRLTTKRPLRHLFIGHSAGGLVSRRVGQLSPDYVSGVITIGTPHQGSFLAQFGTEAAAEELFRKIDRDCYGNVLCTLLADILAEESRSALFFGLDDFAPALEDLRPGSAFLTTLNSTPETFPRVSIDVAVQSRFAIARMIGDSRSPQEGLLTGDRPAGDARVTEVENLYATAALLHRLAQFAIFTPYLMSAGIECRTSGYQSFWPGCTNPFGYEHQVSLWLSTLLLYLTYEVSGAVTAILDDVDATWTQLTTRGREEGDGLIHVSSQRYPNVPGTHTPLRVTVRYPDADSHAGEYKSPSVLSATFRSIALMEVR